MTRCAVNNCKTSPSKKPTNVYMHRFPKTVALRRIWIDTLRSKCNELNFDTGRVCSLHFEKKWYDINKQLKPNAIPTLFISEPENSKSSNSVRSSVDKITKYLTSMPNAQIMSDIKSSIENYQEPANLSDYLTADFKCKSDAPEEVQLWCTIMKQQHLIERQESVLTSLRKSIEDSKHSKRELETNLETYKYIVKCLQEKQAMLEEQVEILTAVESR